MAQALGVGHGQFRGGLLHGEKAALPRGQVLGAVPFRAFPGDTQGPSAVTTTALTLVAVVGADEGLAIAVTHTVRADRLRHSAAAVVVFFIAF